MEMSGKHNFPGRLFIVEGIDGSGKSTQLSLLHRWLESEGHALVFSEWNSRGLRETNPDATVCRRCINRSEEDEDQNMGRFSFFGQAIARIDPEDLKGKLLVIEGADGVGRTTQIELLKQWLEIEGYAVLVTRTTRSALAGKKLRRAKKGTTLGQVTMALFYVTDFADRLEHEIIPALKAGFIVLADRYIYTLVARALVRGIDPVWIIAARSTASP